jgi:hypothetical protein
MPSSSAWQSARSPSIAGSSTFGDSSYPRPYRTPPDFGRALYFDPMDKKLFKFCKCAPRNYYHS